nr:MAG TPA: hypothetical protein [Caudoviricetes sp.]
MVTGKHVGGVPLEGQGASQDRQRRFTHRKIFKPCE